MSKATAPRILHLHSTFDAGGKEVRNVRLINAWGREVADHAIVSGEPERRGAAELLGRQRACQLARVPRAAGRPTPGRLKPAGAAMAGYDLICTYNWGAIDAVMAHTLFADAFRLPPLVHHEDGFNEDEAQRPQEAPQLVSPDRAGALVRRWWCRPPRWRISRCDVWQQPRTRVQRIANGIDTRAFAAPPKPRILPGLIKHKGRILAWLAGGLAQGQAAGSAGARHAAAARKWQLVIAGEGPERGHAAGRG